MDNISGTGNKKIDLGKSKASDIYIDLSKSDSTSKKLTAKLYSDGKVIDSDTAETSGEQILLSA